MLFHHGIVVDCVAEVTMEGLYSFITTELINEEVDDVRIEGMNQCFIYEDFHPNNEYDARNGAMNFVSDLFGRSEKTLVIELAADEVCNSNGVRIGTEEFRAATSKFYSSYAAFTHHSFECTACKLEGEYATVTMDGSWSALKTASLEAVAFEGEGVIKLRKSPFGGYDVVQACLPGLVI
jgi:hypothetical protein